MENKMTQHKKSGSISFHNASLNIDGRQLWQNLNLEIAQGEFLAVLGPNGAGKTSLLRVLLGITSLTNGKVEMGEDIACRDGNSVGYIPQQKDFDRSLSVRGRDIVRFGLDGHQYGFHFYNAAAARRIDKAIEEVGASSYADKPIGYLSGGEQQRLRIAQAMLGNPKILLCDEPLASLDIPNQQVISNLIGKQYRENKTTVIFVTHEINPVLPMVDRVLYLTGERWAAGTPQEVLTTTCLSQLYATPVNVTQINGRIVVAPGELELTGSHLPCHTQVLRSRRCEWA